MEQEVSIDVIQFTKEDILCMQEAFLKLCMLDKKFISQENPRKTTQ